MSGPDPAGEPRNLAELARGIRSGHAHVPVGDVNDHRMTLAVNKAPYPWHRHPDSDEIFVILEGALRLDFVDGGSVELGPSDAYVVPAGTVHRSTPLGRCVNLIVGAADAETHFLTGEPDPGGSGP